MWALIGLGGYTTLVLFDIVAGRKQMASFWLDTTKTTTPLMQVRDKRATMTDQWTYSSHWFVTGCRIRLWWLISLRNNAMWYYTTLWHLHDLNPPSAGTSNANYVLKHGKGHFGFGPSQCPCNYHHPMKLENIIMPLRFHESALPSQFAWTGPRSLWHSARRPSQRHDACSFDTRRAQVGAGKRQRWSIAGSGGVDCHLYCCSDCGSNFKIGRSADKQSQNSGWWLYDYCSFGEHGKKPRIVACTDTLF